MAYPVSLSTLRARALQAANLESSDAFITPEELTGLINGSIAEWVDEVRGTTWSGTYTRSSYTFSTDPTQADPSRYPLPADFLSLLSVDVFVTPGSPVVTAIAFQEEQRNLFRNSPAMFGWGFSHPIYYQLQGPHIAFIPIPSGVYSVRLNYVPTAPQLSMPEDTIDSVNGWEEFIVLDAAIKCLIKDGDTDMIPFLTQRLATQRERIRSMAARRDQQTAEQVHVVANRGLSEWDW